MNELIAFLDSQDVKYQRNVKLSEHTTVAIGGLAKIIIFPKSKQQFTKVLKYLSENNVLFKVVGNMSNILPSDSNIETVIISTKKMTAFSVFSSEIIADSGVLFSKLIMSAAKRSLGGCESLFGIPGTVGGMISMNAGAYGFAVSDFLSEVELYDCKTGEVITLKRADIEFSYRDSEIKRQNLIVLSAEFKLSVFESEVIFNKIREIKRKRAESQPIAAKSLGSVFRKSESCSASYLIDRCGLKGTAVGNVSVSEKHAGFFVNNGGGTAADFLKLSEIVKKTVKEKYGVELTEEFEYLF